MKLYHQEQQKFYQWHPETYAKVKQWHWDTLGEKAMRSLKAKEFDAVYYVTRQAAIDHAMQYVEPGCSVALGGSMTIHHQLELKGHIEGKGGKILDDNYPNPPEVVWAAMRQHLVCDVFFSSSNAVTLDGCLVNIDGIGNRTNAITFGPKKVVVIAGINKICKDVPTALERVENIAAPMNAARLNKDTPCAKVGHCVECKSDDTMCRIYSIIKRKPRLTDITVILIGEELGF